MANNDYRLVRGMKDLTSEDARVFDFIVETANKLAQNHNFQHLTTPIVEFSTLFERNLGCRIGGYYCGRSAAAL